MTCRIHRDIGEQILRVDSPSGERSQLFDELANRLGDREVALGFYGLTETEGFKESVVRTGEEATAPQVLRYAQMLQAKPISGKVLRDMAGALSNLDMRSSEFLQKIEDTFYTDGVFGIYSDKLASSGMFEDSELNILLGDPSKLGELSTTVQSLYWGNQLGEIPSVEPIPQQMKSFGELNGFGKMEVVSDSELDATVMESLAGLDGKYFDQAVEDLGIEWIAESYQNDAEFAKWLRDRYSGKSEVVYLGRDFGVLSKDTQPTLRRTVRQGDFQKMDELFLFTVLPQETWEANPTELREELGAALEELVDFNIDPTGMADTIVQLGYVEGKRKLSEVLEAVRKISQNVVTADDIQMLSDLQNQSQNIEGREGFYTDADSGLVLPPQGLSDTKLYEEHSLVRAGDYYRKIQVKGNGVFEGIMEMVREGRISLPKSVFKSAYVGSRYSKTLRDSPNRREEVTEDIRQHFRRMATNYAGRVEGVSLDSIAEMLGYGLVYQQDMSPRNPDKSELITKIMRFKDTKGTVVKSVGKFVGDFWNKVLTEKVKESQEYEQVYSKFKVRDGKLTFEGNSYDKQMVILGMDGKMMEGLQNYARITNTNMDFILNDELSTEWGTQEEQLYYVNNPTAAPRFQGEYRFRKKLLHTTNIPAKFLRLGDVLYQRIAEGDGAVYSALESNYSDTLVLENQKMPQMPVSFGFAKKHSLKVKKVPSSELAEINEKIDKCQI